MSKKSQSRTGAPVERYSPERPYRPLVSPPSVEDNDACAIYASVRKDASPSHAPIELPATVARWQNQKLLESCRFSSRSAMEARAAPSEGSTHGPIYPPGPVWAAPMRAR